MANNRHRNWEIVIGYFMTSLAGGVFTYTLSGKLFASVLAAGFLLSLLFTLDDMLKYALEDTLKDAKE